MERTREKQMLDLNTGTPYETVTLTMIGRNRSLFLNIIEEGMRHQLSSFHIIALFYYKQPDKWQLRNMKGRQ